MHRAIVPTPTLASGPTNQTLSDRGLTGWLIDMIGASAWKGKQRNGKKELRVIEILAIAPKTSLVLVSCGAERFLVGTGSEGVQTIVRLTPEALYSETFTQDGKQ